MPTHIARPFKGLVLMWRIYGMPSKQALFQKLVQPLILPLFLLFLTGCQISPYIRHLHEDDHLLVRLEDHTGGPFPENPTQFDHPITLSEAQWGQLLRAIQIQRQPGGDPVYGLEKESEKPEKKLDSLFTEAEVLSLQKYVAQAFAQARSSEWVTFVIRHPLGSYQWLNKTITVQSMSSGGFYVSNHILQLYLTNIRTPITSTAIGELIWDNPFYVSDAAFYQVQSNAIQTVKKLPQKGLRGKINPSIYELALNMQKILEPNKGKKQNVLAEEKAMPSHESSVAKKLRDLLILKQNGLITEENYNVMKRKVLEQFIDESP